jgi:hypothetical protein
MISPTIPRAIGWWGVMSGTDFDFHFLFLQVFVFSPADFGITFYSVIDATNRGG